MSIPQQLLRLGSILRELTATDLGYPLGENVVTPPQPGAADALTKAGLAGITGLLDFYSACDGVSMPDVHIGYFIKPLRRVLQYDPNSEPQTVLLEREVPVISLGSTGGGSLFVAERDNGRILLLPPGPLHEGRYDGRGAKVLVVAESVSHFLDQLIKDAAAFVRCEQGHRYLPDR